ncbi:PepSY domain-containing protein [Ornithinibacillus sp. BX22]|uniref:PepSY domain-containing protein n=2 Tax=Ornithinibacillus TaxID=484508 RepID=A0A923RI43_9BACI|nr:MULTISPECIES: PepSY domain-containing protein [Ornithinibacillus]MBC5636965.1 PepSY domain-containing protein [Ornithinibacillus hominis]MBS3681531.1 PepSY domain-containing protein [Ornithinibacillus massiliensis]
MKKKVLITVSSIAIATVLGLGIYHSNAAQADPKLSKEEIVELVTAQYPGTITEIEMEKGFNSVVYEVEVESNGKEYEIKLDGNTGEVLKIKQRERHASTEESTNLTISEKQDKPSSNSTSESESKNGKINDSDDNTATNSKDNQDDNVVEESKKDNQADNGKIENKKEGKKAIIDYETAKKIALAEFDGIITELELDEDDGRLIYEIEIESVNGEAEIDIDAYTGDIISISIDTEIGDDDDRDDD